MDPMPAPGLPGDDPVTTREVGVNIAGAQALWDALTAARATGTATAQAAVEDTLFRWYLPLARAAAASQSAAGREPATVLGDAEVGLSQAILAWNQQDCSGFDRFARATITGHLRLRTRRSRRRRVDPW